MTEFRRHARFQLAVVGLTALAVAGIYVVTGDVLVSLAGFAVMALLGVRAFVRRSSKGSPVHDERDQTMQRRAFALGYTALWFVLIVWAVGVTLAFADRGSVPLAWVAPVVWVGWWLMIGVRAATVLVLDRPGV